MIAVLKYNAGNAFSVLNALGRMGADAVYTDDPALLGTADKVIFPGVGAAGPAMAYLRERGLDEIITNLRAPFLGICLGLQILCRRSAENTTECLGIFPETVQRFPEHERVPHVGWNNFSSMQGPLFRGLALRDDVYYVHSYYAAPAGSEIAVCHYAIPFAAALCRDNFYAVQFHPEKSAATGQRILQNFLRL